MKRGWNLLGLTGFAGLLLAYAMIRGGFSGWFLFYGSAFFVINALCVYGWTSRRWQVVRHIETHRPWFSGDDLPVVLSVRSETRIPLAWMIIEDCWIHCGSGRMFQHRTLVMPGWRKHVTCRYTINGMDRGRHRFHSVRVLTGDLFGLVWKSVSIEQSMEWTVQPKPLPVQSLPAASEAAQGLRRSAEREAAQMRGVREYVHGDPAKRIHWKSAARYQTLRTKEVEGENLGQVIVCLDTGSRPSQTRDDRAFEQCVEAAAGWVHYGRQHHIPVRLLCGDQRQAAQAAPQQRITDYPSALRILSEVTPDDAISAHDVLRKEAAGLAPYSFVVAITPELEEEWVHTAGMLRRRRIKLLLIYCGSAGVASWHERRRKERLEASGCEVCTISGYAAAAKIRGGIGNVTA